jgi:hypothetical protein
MEPAPARRVLTQKHVILSGSPNPFTLTERQRRYKEIGDIFSSNVLGISCENSSPPMAVAERIHEIFEKEVTSLPHKDYICCPSCAYHIFTVNEPDRGDQLWIALQKEFTEKRVHLVDLFLLVSMEGYMNSAYKARNDQCINELLQRIEKLERDLLIVNSNVEYLLGLEVNREGNSAVHKRPKMGDKV